jgi:hypothetical protein
VSDFTFYKRNVGYVVGGRWYPTDEKGWTLTLNNPYIAVKPEQLRDFKTANKRAILEGLIIQSDEPVVDWETPNAVSDEKAAEIVKLPFLALKKQIEDITSIATMSKIVETAKELDRPKRTLALLENRLEELTADDVDDFGYSKNKGARGVE